MLFSRGNAWHAGYRWAKRGGTREVPDVYAPLAGEAWLKGYDAAISAEPVWAEKPLLAEDASDH